MAWTKHWVSTSITDGMADGIVSVDGIPATTAVGGLVLSALDIDLDLLPQIHYDLDVMTECLIWQKTALILIWI